MQTAVITGANRGIGLELCRQLAAGGTRVVGVCRKSSPALEALGQTVIDGIDVADPNGLAGLARALADHGVERIDMLINNAGILKRQAFGEIDGDAIASMQAQFTVNAIGPVLVTQALAHLLGPDAKVGIVTSRMGSIADNTSGGHYGYRMSKAAANAAGASLAHDLSARGIAVALLHPGYVRTDMTRGGGDVDASEAAAGLIGVMTRLTPATTGAFWHANGERLPW